MIRILLVGLLFAVRLNAFSFSGIGPTEALLIREAKKISEQLGDSVWPGISKTPFTIVLVTDSLEFLIYHPYPSTDFVVAGKDPILGETIYQRKRTFQKDLLATFPAVNGVNCIVVGTVANTGRSVTNWMITLLHEHFHQYVNTQPNHFDEVNNLNLSGGDQTGMWMLNYPFPYDSLPVIKQYEKLSAALLSSIQTIGKKTFRTNYSQYRLEKKSFSKMVKPNDYKYFCFQVWQEGLAGYTEYKFIQLLKSYAFPSDILQIEGFTAMEEYSRSFYKAQIKNLQELILPEHKRICVYGVGFAEGLLLDTINPDWRKLYFKNKFSTDSYYTKTK